MNLEVICDYLSFLAEAQYALCQSRAALQTQTLNSFSFYKLLATRSQPFLTSQMVSSFLKSFTYNFQMLPPQQMTKSVNYQLMPQDQKVSQEELMQKGVELWMRRYANEGKMTFEEFCLFMKEEQQLPQKAVELGFPVKRKFFALLESQIQNILYAESFKRAVGLYYKNLTDLFQELSGGSQLTINNLKNLFLMSGQRKDDLFYEMLLLRFPMPMDETTFKRWFTVPPNPNKYKLQTKVYYSSIKRKKFQYNHEEEDKGSKFMTPSGKKTTAAAGMTSTKMTKGERLNSIKRSAVEVSRFVTEDFAVEGKKSQMILADILAEEERVNQMKRQLIYQQDYDLQLFYERKGRQFQQILNRKYGTCNYTSFVRYIVPQDYQHRYVAFIRYNHQNILSEETSELIETLLEEQRRKESRIEQWWAGQDREVVFRGYCGPGDKGISHKQLNKYFTERECGLLLDRFDPNKTGTIEFEYFL